MELIKWSFSDLSIYMIEIDGVLYTTTGLLARVLGIQTHALSMLCQRNSERVRPLKVTQSELKEFLNKNRSHLAIKRLKHNLLLWSENDMIWAAILAKAPQARQFQEEVVSMVKRNAVKSTVSKKDHAAVLDELATAREQLNEVRDKVQSLERFQDLVIAHVPGLNESASLAGKILATQKKSKSLRSLH